MVIASADSGMSVFLNLEKRMSFLSASNPLAAEVRYLPVTALISPDSCAEEGGEAYCSNSQQFETIRESRKRHVSSAGQN